MRMNPNFEMVGDGTRKEVKLLVVDDCVDHFEQVRLFAEMYSPRFAIDCKLAQGETEAKKEMDSWAPSVVLVDVHLITSALELIRCLALKGASVIALSEGRIPQLAETAQSYGAVGCFRKSDNPDDIEQLMGYIAAVAESTPSSH